ncbi:FIG00388203: hypothetical protein [hydrothermal vent metagenome]|uniref:PD-(D/E)XK endonuclease-like domain-containing protein n=1 Tax=hydrothermal vent metagenome TaxID=652676 RepID=A0A1W1BTC2_9ZZZZ
MNRLYIYPTSRVLRRVSELSKESSGFLPTLMRMDEFEKRAILLADRVMVDPLSRILYLREASNFSEFKTLKLDRELVRFFTKSDAIFKFFEELEQEEIEFSRLVEADPYAEFDRDISILESLRDRYREILDSRSLTDRVFLPKEYKLNESFISRYEEIVIHIEGYLSRFEMNLISKCSLLTRVIIHFTTNRFNQKMIDRFGEYGIDLPLDSVVSFDFAKKRIIKQEPNRATIDAKVLKVDERYEQIALAFTEIEQMVASGISPEDIALILPDESLKDSFLLYDHLHNLNFAMGFEYSKRAPYKKLEALYRYWSSYDKESRYLLERYGVNISAIESISPTRLSTVGSFFELLDSLKLLNSTLATSEALWKRGDGEEQLFEAQRYMLQIFDQELTIKDWLFLWMRHLSTITIDDSRGGKVTVMGVLETRGMSYEGVVIVDFNDGIVPTSSSKDQFLNTTVRTFAKLPTLSDRESLQKYYYKRLFERASKLSIIYSSSDNRLVSKFLYELGIEGSDIVPTQLSILYNEQSKIVEMQDPLVEEFNARDVVWSPSKLKVYLDCKRKYYYRYIEGIKPKKDDQLNEGSLLHNLLDHLYRKQDHYTSIDDMRRDIDILLDELLPLKDAKIVYQKMLWREKLAGYIQQEIEHFAKGWRVVAREHEAVGDIGGLRFRGRIDRIDQNSTDTLVIDYKSGSTSEANRVKNLENLTDFQMSIYSHILSQTYQNITLSFMKILEGGKLEEITLLDEKNSLLSEHIVELKETKSFTASRCEELQKCKYCEFVLLCERGDYL